MRIRRALSRFAIFVALAAEGVVLAASTDAFFTVDNLSNVLRQNAFTAILGAGMTFVILTGGIDLSVGSVVALSGVLCADVLSHGSGLAAGIAAGLLVGVATGGFIGLVVTRIGIPPFVVSLAMLLVARGAAYKYTDARTISGLPAPFASLSTGLAPTAIMALVFVLAWVLLLRTPFGRHIYAIGGNREAAWPAGIRVN